jgi:NTE family protein
MLSTLRNEDFSLVLSGGGALGIAHVGVLADMKRLDLHPSEIVGTSMGGIIGACYAAGMDAKEIFALIERFGRVTNWLKLSFSGNAVIEHDRIAEIFRTIFGDRRIGELDLPLKLVATELTHGHKRVFNADDDVSVVDALLATMAIPGIFEEMEIEGETYGDGFLCANLAVEDAAYDAVLASDVLGENAFEKSLPDNFFKTANVLEMFERSMRLLICNQTRQILAHTKKNVVLLDIPTAGYKTYHFHKAEAIRKLGEGVLWQKV